MQTDLRFRKDTKREMKRKRKMRRWREGDENIHARYRSVSTFSFVRRREGLTFFQLQSDEDGKKERAADGQKRLFTVSSILDGGWQVNDEVDEDQDVEGRITKVLDCVYRVREESGGQDFLSWDF